MHNLLWFCNIFDYLSKFPLSVILMYLSVVVWNMLIVAIVWVFYCFCYCRWEEYEESYEEFSFWLGNIEQSLRKEVELQASLLDKQNTLHNYQVKNKQLIMAPLVS